MRWTVMGAFLVGLLVSEAVDLAIARVPRRERVFARRAGQPRSLVIPLLTAAASAGMAARLEGSAALPAFLLFTAVLIVVAAIDMHHLIVPNRVVGAALLVGSISLLVAAAVDDGWSNAARAVLGAVLAAGGLLALHLIDRRWMGMGDVKLGLVLGMFLGWRGLDHVFLGLLLGFALGAVGSGLLIATGRRSRKDHIPFAPFLAAGAYLAIVLGPPLLDWYVS